MSFTTRFFFCPSLNRHTTKHKYTTSNQSSELTIKLTSEVSVRLIPYLSLIKHWLNESPLFFHLLSTKLDLVFLFCAASQGKQMKLVNDSMLYVLSLAITSMLTASVCLFKIEHVIPDIFIY